MKWITKFIGRECIPDINIFNKRRSSSTKTPFIEDRRTIYRNKPTRPKMYPKSLVLILLSGVVFVGAAHWDCVPSFCKCLRYEVHCEMSADVNQGGQTYYGYAEKVCADRGGRLANLNTKEIDDCVRDFISDNNLDEPPCINKPQWGFFIGLTDVDNEGTFVWNNGIEICGSTYSNWAPREPNNNTRKDPNGQDCVQLWYRFGNNGKWDDEYCNCRPKGFVCEIPTDCCCNGSY
ncbi:perlucin-like protein [Ptychodera flava]|uniref:perlucin-like protein n=1 Tax=Ptychodera flava TaxID=63121 RepID=UPI00396AB177